MDKVLGKIIYIVVMGIFVVFGLYICTAMVLSFHDEYNYYKTAHPVTAEVSRVWTSNSGVVSTNVTYNIDGREYTSRLDGVSSSLREGNILEVYYQLDNPYEIKVKTLSYELLIIPIAIIIIVVIIVLHVLLKKKRKNKLIKNGQIIYAEVSEVLLDLSYSSHGRNPHRIICKYTDPYGTVHSFRSEKIWYNPSGSLRSDKVPVYINESNFKKYYVKVDDILPEKVYFYQ